MRQRFLKSMAVLAVLTQRAVLIACQDGSFPDSNALLAESAAAEVQSPNVARRELPKEGVQFIRGIALLLLPPTFEDEDGWGRETRIQSGLNVEFEDGRLKTSRRWKSVNHGSWLQGSGALVEPDTTFRLKAVVLPEPGEKTSRYDIRASARLYVTGRQQQWNYGVMLWSISADAIADVSLHVVVDVKSEVVSTNKGTRLRFQPNIVEAAASLDRFRLRRISHAKGVAVREFGEWIESIVRNRIRRENKELPARINKAVSRKSDRLEIPLVPDGWFKLPVGVDLHPAPKPPKANEPSLEQN